MQYFVAAAALVGAAQAWGNYSTSEGTKGSHPYTTTITDVVESYTTVCPEATKITQGTVTYTATAHEVITVTNCPCQHAITTVVTPGVPATKTALVTTTEVVESYTTVCPEETVLTIPGPKTTVTYSAKPSETVTVTNGPFTTTKSVPTTVVFTPGPAPAVQTSPAAPAAAPAAGQPAPVAPAPAAGTGSPIKPQTATPSAFTGAAAHTAAGFGLSGLLAVVAYFL